MPTPSPLAELLDCYPLPQGFSLSEVFDDVLDFNGLKLAMVGLVATRQEDGAAATGSAAQAGQLPWGRAYFELLERVAIQLAVRSDQPTFASLAADGRQIGELARDEVFPADTEDFGQKPSVTNGVALHSDFAEAARRAEVELAERDGVLASWWGEAPVQSLATPANRGLEHLPPSYDVEAYALGDGGTLGHRSAGVFAFPKTPTAPLVYGFGAGANVEAAGCAAADEALQRLAFLWGEDIPHVSPPPSPTSDFHQEYHLVPDHLPALRAWLRGEYQQPQAPAEGASAPELKLADLTPAPLRGRLWVVRALASSVRRLCFGPQRTRRGRPLPPAQRVHPMI